MWKFLVFLFLPLSLTLTAQYPVGSGKKITGTISGSVRDTLTREPVPFASVGLIDQETDKTVDGTVTDEHGKFRISAVAMGTYRLQVVFIGYQPSEISAFTLTPEKPDVDVKVVWMQSETMELDEVRVVGEGPLVEAKADRIVYNAEKDITTRGGDAADVLRNVPLLAVDFDGNVSLRGSENVRILINGRPSGIFSASVADALKMMPADQIKAVEVITSPSAKYDGEGTAGIINIITKKKNIEGLAGSVDLTAGTRSNRGNMNVNYGRGRLGINASGGGHYAWPQTGESNFRREDYSAGTPSFLTQDGFNTSDRLGYRFSLGTEYNINALNQLSGGFTTRGHRSSNDNDVLSTYSVNEQVEEIYRRTTDGLTNRGGWDLEGVYSRKFKQDKQEWSLAFELDKDDNFSDYDYDLSYALPQTFPDALENNGDRGDNIELTLQTDYAHPVTEDFLLEAGLKGTLRDIESDFEYQVYDPDQAVWKIDPLRTDVFYYDQDVFGGYVSGQFSLGKDYTLIAGTRLEWTVMGGDFEVVDNPFQNDYLNLLPNFTLSRKVGDYNQIKVSYNQRIQRPSQRNVNPFVEYNDERDISYGNPYLAPELMHQVEIGTNLFIKGSTINLALFGRRTEDLIETLLYINDEDVSETTFQNFGTRYAVGINAFGSVSIGKKFTIRGGADFNYWSSEGQFEGEELSNSGIDYNGRITLTYNLSETLKMEGFSFFRSPTYTVQGKLPNWVMSSFAIKQEFFNRKLILGLSISQPFQENQVWEREMTGTDFYQNNTTIRPVRSIGINVGYKFGKLDAKDRSGKKNKINNTDQKEEQGEGQF
jgi:outer membrane receptor for ferrienterochelin and colicin